MSEPIPVRLRLGLIALLPTAFAVFGATVIYWALQLRQYLPASRGIVSGAVVMLSGAIAAWWLLRANARAVWGVAIAGILTWVTVFGLQILFPLVNASSEPPSFLAEYGWAGAMILVPLATVAGVVSARALLRRADSGL